MIWSSVADLPHLMITGPSIAELQKAGGLIEGVSGIRMTSAYLVADDRNEPLRLPAMAVSANLFDLLGVQPALGRGFRPDEEGPRAGRVAVLSDGLRKHLGADPSIIGTEMKLSSSVFTVVGVMPPDFAFNGSSSRQKPDIYIPFDLDLSAAPPKSATPPCRQRTPAAPGWPSTSARKQTLSLRAEEIPPICEMKS